MLEDLSATEIRLRLSQAQDTDNKPITLSNHFPHINPKEQQSYIGESIHSTRPAAVLVPLLRVDHEWHLLFILRAEIAFDLHSGQVAFPGGGSEDHENAAETALREANEEIGLKPDDVEIIGELDQLKTISGFIITPVVGIIPYPYPFKLMPTEVSEIFTIPLSWLANPQHYEERDVILEIPTQGKIRREPLRVIYYSPYQGKTLWGASARITHQLLAKLKS